MINFLLAHIQAEKQNRSLSEQKPAVLFLAASCGQQEASEGQPRGESLETPPRKTLHDMLGNPLTFETPNSKDSEEWRGF
jgi:hypothetical protein